MITAEKILHLSFPKYLSMEQIFELAQLSASEHEQQVKAAEFLMKCARCSESWIEEMIFGETWEETQSAPVKPVATVVVEEALCVSANLAEEPTVKPEFSVLEIQSRNKSLRERCIEMRQRHMAVLQKNAATVDMALSIYDNLNGRRLVKRGHVIVDAQSLSHL